MNQIKLIERKYLRKINEEFELLKNLSDDELKNKTNHLKNKFQKGISLDNLVPEAFALVKEVCIRKLNMYLYDVQLLGGIVLHQGKIAEMATGEGKSITAIAPLYLNALTGNPVHLITVNDYLAKRDMDNFKEVYEFLGLTIGCITHDTPQIERREIYQKDVIYITNVELGFDYLKDNMVKHLKDKVQTENLYYCIIDEADSILIDEARTPLIISSSKGKANDLYVICDVFVKHLNNNDIEIDKSSRQINFNENGIKKVEKFFCLNNYSDIENTLLRHHLEQSLKANFDMCKDKEYIVKNNQILLIDEHTGRIAEGRRFSNGLHQAIEAKEGVKIKDESITLANITYQNLFKQYIKLSGMTGTAKTEEKELKEIYKLSVVEIPTNKPCIRVDKSDLIFVTEHAKNQAIINDIKNCYKIGRPILIGTLNIEKSELLSDLLKKENIPHSVLNAKQHELEANIVANAGKKFAVTIATNMAGRGTDIKLTEETRQLGGLKIIASERASNRRIDNQLKGRSGRQGDPGESQFYLSLEDELITYVTSDKLKIIANLDKNNSVPINNKVFNNMISACQKRLESKHFDTRKQTIKYDKILNNQRIEIYKQRDYILMNDCSELIKNIINSIIIQAKNSQEWNTKENFLAFFKEYFNFSTKILDNLNKMYDNIGNLNYDNFSQFIWTYFSQCSININELNEIVLNIVDIFWVKHLIDMEELRTDVKWVSYRGEDPIRTYAKEGHALFEIMNYNIKKEITKQIIQIALLHLN